MKQLVAMLLSALFPLIALADETLEQSRGRATLAFTLALSQQKTIKPEKLVKPVPIVKWHWQLDPAQPHYAFLYKDAKPFGALGYQEMRFWFWNNGDWKEGDLPLEAPVQPERPNRFYAPVRPAPMSFIAPYLDNCPT